VDSSCTLSRITCMLVRISQHARSFKQVSPLLPHFDVIFVRSTKDTPDLSLPLRWARLQSRHIHNDRRVTRSGLGDTFRHVDRSGADLSRMGAEKPLDCGGLQPPRFLA